MANECSDLGFRVAEDDRRDGDTSRLFDDLSCSVDGRPGSTDGQLGSYEGRCWLKSDFMEEEGLDGGEGGAPP